MVNVVIAVDAGKYMLKSIGKRIGTSDKEMKQIDCLSKYHYTDDINEDCEGNSYKIVYNNQITIVGDAGKNFDLESDKEKELHKLCAYAAISNFIEPNTTDNHVYMVLACPVDFIRNKELKDAYKAFIKGDGEINININGEDYNFIIEDITIKSEGSGVIYNSPDKFEDKEVALIDLGGVNFSFTVYNDCVAVKDSRFARDMGGNLLNQLAVNKLRDFTKGKPVNKALAEKALKDGFLTLSEQEVEKSDLAIKEVKKEYINKIFEEITAAGHFLRSLKPIFAGGTAEIIKDVVEDIKKDKDLGMGHIEVIKDAQWNAVQGLYVVANNKYGDIK